MQHSPYESSLALEGLEIALAIAAFNQEVALLFKGPGVLQLINQNPDPSTHKEFTKAYTGLSLFGINDVYACQDSLANYDNPTLMLQPQLVDALKIAVLIKSHDIVLNV